MWTLTEGSCSQANHVISWKSVLSDLNKMAKSEGIESWCEDQGAKSNACIEVARALNL